MKLGKTLSGLCTPAFIYLAISLFAILVALFNGTKIIMVLGKTAFVVFWTFLLNLLCKNGYKSFSWFLVLLPYVLLLGGFLTAFYQVKETFADMGASDPTAVATELVSSLMKEKEDEKEGFNDIFSAYNMPLAAIKTTKKCIKGSNNGNSIIKSTC
jgi:hypothetical protein